MWQQSRACETTGMGFLIQDVGERRDADNLILTDQNALAVGSNTIVPRIENVTLSSCAGIPQVMDVDISQGDGSVRHTRQGAQVNIGGNRINYDFLPDEV